MERAGGDEEHVVGLDEAVLGVDGGPLDDRQEVPLHALARDVGAAARTRGRPPCRSRPGTRCRPTAPARRPRAPPGPGPRGGPPPPPGGSRAPRATVALRRFFLPPKRPGSISLTLMSISSTPWLVTISKEGNVLSATSTSTIRSSSLPSRRSARSFARVSSASRLGQRRQEQVDQPLLGAGPGAVADLERLLLAHHLHGDLGQVADDGFDVAPDVAHLGELGRLDLDERRVGQPGEPPRDLRLADARRADHQDVLRQDLARHLGLELLPPPAVAQRHRHRLLGALLPDDELVELRDDLARRQRPRRLFAAAPPPFSPGIRKTMAPCLCSVRIFREYQTQIANSGVDIHIDADSPVRSNRESLWYCTNMTARALLHIQNVIARWQCHTILPIPVRSYPRNFFFASLA